MFVHLGRLVLLTGAALLALASHVARSDAAATPAAAPAAAPPSSCGDGLLVAGETCDSCPADCQASTCRTKGRRKVTINLTTQSGYDKVGAVTVLLAYRKGVLSLPGEKNAPAVKARVSTRQPSAEAFANDLGYGLRVLVSSKVGLIAGPLLDVDLDACADAPRAQAGDLTCRVESCAQGGARLRQCECSVSVP